MFLIPLFSFSQTNFEKAEKLFNQEKYALAKPLFENELKYSPNHIKTIEYLGDISIHLNNLDKAISYYRMLIKLKPNDANFYYKYGGAFRVVNSWGSEYGDNGYIWMRYSDFEKYAVEAYVFELNENLDLPNEDKFELKDDDYSRIKLGASVGAYEGQEYLERLTGYGIFSSKKDDTYYIGKFTNAEMEGYFLFLDDDGLFSSKVIGKIPFLKQLL